MQSKTKLMGTSLITAALHLATANAGQINVNADAWTVTNANLNSRVGINTLSPAAMLDVRPIAFANNQSGGVQLACTDGHYASGMYLRTDSAGIPRLAFDIGSVELMCLNNSSGNVGIGTTYPTGGRLQVNAAGSVNGIYSQLSADGSGNVNAAAVEGTYSGNGTYGALGVAYNFIGDEFPTYYGVYGYSANGYAGYFDGNVGVNGNLSVGGSYATALLSAYNSNGGNGSTGIQGTSQYGYGVRGVGGNIGVYAQNTTSNTVAYLATAALAGDFYGNVYVHGTLTQTSDRNAKQNIEAVDSGSILEKVADLPVTTWSYKTDSGTRHLGPMAQDFRAAFNLGLDDKSIGIIDESGVALAAIQGLNRKVESENAALRAENSELKARLERLERLAFPAGQDSSR